MLSDEGYLKTLPHVSLQPAFEQVVGEVVNGLRHALGDILHSIYLYGSVARGNAVTGVSDLDVCVIFTRPLRVEESEILDRLRQELAAHHPCVSKIDIDPGVLAGVLDPENLYSWGYWLKHHCRCVYGEDLCERFARFRPSKAIAVAVNGDVMAVLKDVISRIQAASDRQERLMLQRAAARKLIRATNMLRSACDTDWPDTLEDYVARVVRRYPQQATALDYFLRESQHPDDDADQFIAQLRAFMAWLNRTYQP